MNSLTKTTIWDFLLVIQERAKFNVLQIKRYNDKIREYEENLTANDIDADGLIARLTKKNEILKSENVMLLTLHQNVLRINDEEDWYSKEDLDHLKNGGLMPDEAISNEECIKRIINGSVSLDDRHHPCFCNSEVVKKAYEELLKLERYEECKLIIQIQNNLLEITRESKKGQGIVDKLLTFPFIRFLRR